MTITKRIYQIISVIIFTATIFCSSWNAWADNSGADIDWKTGKLGRLSEYIGTYNYKAVLDDPSVHKSLEDFLGDELHHLQSNMQVLNPIELQGSELVLWGARAHRADEENAIVIVDIYNGKVHAGIFSNGQTTIFSKVDAETYKVFPKDKIYGLLPHALKEWVRWNEIQKILNTEPNTNFHWVKKIR